MKKYTFIGTGVANVFCVIEMLNNGISGKDIVMIDSGKSPHERQREEIMNGFLGAGAYSDFKIIYSLIRGGDLVKYTGIDKANDLINRIKTIVKDFHPNPEKIVQSGKEKIPKKLKKSIEEYFEILQSESNHIGTDYALEIGKNMYGFLQLKGVTIFFEEEVLDINFNKKEIVTTNIIEMKYDNLIIGVGRSGMNLINTLSKKYNLKTESADLQIGVRFESQAKYFEDLSKVFYDFKLQRSMNGMNIRTFCVNSGAAYVAKEEVNGLISYNGHAYRNEESNGKINFGIMMEVPFDGDCLKRAEDLVKRCNNNDVDSIFTNVYKYIEYFQTLCLFKVLPF